MFTYMKRMTLPIRVWVMGITLLAAVPKPSGGAVSCTAVDTALLPCLSFLTGDSSSPGQFCCSGMETLRAMTPTTTDRRIACGCFKKAASAYPKIKDDTAAALPAKCGVTIDFLISPSTDCNSIKC